MIAALAGGSLPFILRTVMQPEKPEIEIGTVSFKNQMDEIIKNFVQCWPIYDLPFDVYTAEQEEMDRQKKEQEEQSAAATAEGKDLNIVPGKQLACPTNPGIPLPLPSTSNFPFESGVDTVDGRLHVEGNHVNDPVSPAPSDGAQSTTASHHVCFDVDTKDKEPEVDIVIYLPSNKRDEMWLDEWSDLDDAASSSGESFADADGDVFPMTDLA